MGNDPSKRSNQTAADSDDDDPDGPVRIGGNRRKKAGSVAGAAGAAASAASDMEGATLGGHTPYHAPLSVLPPTGGPQSFDEDRHSDAAYAALDDSMTPSTPSGAAAAAAHADGPVSIGGGRKRIEGDIVQDSSLSRPTPSDALNITPVLMRPRAVMDVYASLAHRWSGVGVAAARGQVLVAKEMDKMETIVHNALQPVMDRHAQIKALNQELAFLPDLHATLQRQQQAIAQCVRTMQELNNLLPAHVRLEDLDEILEWQEAKQDEDEEEDEENGEGAEGGNTPAAGSNAPQPAAPASAQRPAAS